MHASDPLLLRPDCTLVADFGVDRALALNLLPWQVWGGTTIILGADVEIYFRHLSELRKIFGATRLQLAPARVIQSAILRDHAIGMALGAETRVDSAKSSRHWNARSFAAKIVGICMAIILCSFVAPQTTFIIGCLFATFLTIAGTALKAACLVVTAKRSAPPPAPPRSLPTISILVPVFRETAIIPHLCARLDALDYPVEKLDICLITEATDHSTRRALTATRLPLAARILTVPGGALQTKPRALNYALSFARGEIIGIYDAEDAPAQDQLLTVAAQFNAARQDVACLQGALDYYNTGANWLTRCFTIEYATWFRVVLPGLARLGLVVPLGGTTLFFKRDILEELGGWDAHNVTEDADLGIRLARHGYRTEILASVTREEANGHIWPWIKQRSRWLKGYAITYLVHMRNPGALHHDLGLWRFCGIQLLFLGALLQFALAPLLWSFWILLAGLTHPVHAQMGSGFIWGLACVFITCEFISLGASFIATRRAGKRRLWLWIPMLHLYFPLAVIALYRGIGQLVTRPFYWDKTAHGILMPHRLLRRGPRNRA